MKNYETVDMVDNGIGNIIPVIGYIIPGIGYMTPGIGHTIPDIGYMIPGIGIGYCGYWLNWYWVLDISNILK